MAGPGGTGGGGGGLAAGKGVLTVASLRTQAMGPGRAGREVAVSALILGKGPGFHGASWDYTLGDNGVFPQRTATEPSHQRTAPGATLSLLPLPPPPPLTSVPAETS